MEIILKKDIKGLGYKNDILKVKDGYARNFLIPQKIAILATASNKKMQIEESKQTAFKEDKLRKQALELSAKLSAELLKVGAKTGEGGRIFGSVTNIQLAESLKKAGYNIERKNIELKDTSIKTLGSYVAKVTLYKEVFVDLNFDVVSE